MRSKARRGQETCAEQALRDNPHLSAERPARTRALINEAVRDCLGTGYEDLIDSLALPDAGDRHVLAAAIRAGAEVIVTYNLRDFPAGTLACFDMEALHPDDFLIGLLDLAPGVVCGTVRRQRDSLRNPPKSIEELLATFEGQWHASVLRVPWGSWAASRRSRTCGQRRT